MVINHLLSGMILQVATVAEAYNFHHVQDGSDLKTLSTVSTQK